MSSASPATSSSMCVWSLLRRCQKHLYSLKATACEYILLIHVVLILKWNQLSLVTSCAIKPCMLFSRTEDWPIHHRGSRIPRGPSVVLLLAFSRAIAPPHQHKDNMSREFGFVDRGSCLVHCVRQPVIKNRQHHRLRRPAEVSAAENAARPYHGKDMRTQRGTNECGGIDDAHTLAWRSPRTAMDSCDVTWSTQIPDLKSPE